MQDIVYKKAKPSGWTRAQVEAFAERVAAQLGYQPGADITQSVEKLGGRIAHNDWSSARETGSIEIQNPGKFVIQLSPLSGGKRGRFTIAHELGHYFLHSKAGTLSPMSVQRDGLGRAEWEANWFAAGFLMPAGTFREKLGQELSNAELAEFFDVSEAAVAVRRESI